MSNVFSNGEILFIFSKKEIGKILNFFSSVNLVNFPCFGCVGVCVKFSISKNGKQNSLVMRFSQPTSWNVRKGGYGGFFKCQKAIRYMI
jgi:hypothetical protein